MKQNRSLKLEVVRPDIFGYHDYQVFLTDWLEFKKSGQAKLSLRALARQAGVASGYLSMVLAKKRPLSAQALAKLMPHLGLSAHEQSFLENLLSLGTSDSHEVRVAALDRMKRFQQFQKLNPKETEVYQYLTHWYYVAIRELGSLSDFKADAEWIQKKLSYAVPLSEVREALEFLLANKYLVQAADGSVTHPEVSLECVGGVYRVALAKFHRELFQLAALSIEKTPSGERNIQGHTCALSADGFDKAQEIVNEAIGKIRALGKSEQHGDAVYHLELALFPLSGRYRESRRT